MGGIGQNLVIFCELWEKMSVPDIKNLGLPGLLRGWPVILEEFDKHQKVIDADQTYVPLDSIIKNIIQRLFSLCKILEYYTDITCFITIYVHV